MHFSDIPDPGRFLKPPSASLSKAGEESPDALFLGVGSCLSVWSEIEDELCRLFLHLCCPPRVDVNFLSVFRTLERAFSGVEAVSTRLTMVENAAEAVFGFHYEKAIKKEWCLFKDTIKFATYRRNEVAHGSAKQISSPRREPQGWFWCAAISSPRSELFGSPHHITDYGTLRSGYKYNAKDLLSLTLKFNLIIEMIKGISTTYLSRNARGDLEVVVEKVMSEKAAQFERFKKANKPKPSQANDPSLDD